MTAGDFFWNDYNPDEDPLLLFLKEFDCEDGVKECQALQVGHKSAPVGSPVELEHDRGSYSEIVNTETSSTDTCDPPTASSAPNAEILSEPQDGRSSASLGTVTWSRQDNGLFVCHLCNYSSKKISNQMTHSRTHTGERPFNCGLCAQTFKQRHHLERHRRIHTNESLYVCTICQATFTTTTPLHRYMCIQSKKYPKICATCNSELANKDCWIRHVRHMK